MDDKRNKTKAEGENKNLQKIILQTKIGYKEFLNESKRAKESYDKNEGKKLLDPSFDPKMYRAIFGRTRCR